MGTGRRDVAGDGGARPLRRVRPAGLGGRRRRGSASATATWRPTCTARRGSAEGATLDRGDRRDRARVGRRRRAAADDRRALPNDADRLAGRRGGAVPGLLRAAPARRADRVGQLRADVAGCAAEPRGPAALDASRRRRDRARRTRSCRSVRSAPCAGVDELLAARRDRWSPCRRSSAGRRSKGPADRMLAELGLEPSVVGVARLYAADRRGARDRHRRRRARRRRRGGRHAVRRHADR